MRPENAFVKEGDEKKETPKLTAAGSILRREHHCGAVVVSEALEISEQIVDGQVRFTYKNDAS